MLLVIKMIFVGVMSFERNSLSWESIIEDYGYCNTDCRNQVIEHAAPMYSCHLAGQYYSEKVNTFQPIVDILQREGPLCI